MAIITVGIGIEIRRMSPASDGFTVYAVDGRSSGITRQSRIHVFLKKVMRTASPSLVVPSERGEEYERHASLSHAANNTDVETIVGSEIYLADKEYCLFAIDLQIITPRAAPGGNQIVNFGERRYFTAMVDGANLYLAHAGQSQSEEGPWTPLHDTDLAFTEFDKVIT